jgi:hypothetical protein
VADKFNGSVGLAIDQSKSTKVAGAKTTVAILPMPATTVRNSTVTTTVESGRRSDAKIGG